MGKCFEIPKIMQLVWSSRSRTRAKVFPLELIKKFYCKEVLHPPAVYMGKKIVVFCWVCLRDMYIQSHIVGDHMYAMFLNPDWLRTGLTSSSRVNQFNRSNHRVDDFSVGFGSRCAFSWSGVQFPLLPSAQRFWKPRTWSKIQSIAEWFHQV